MAYKNDYQLLVHPELTALAAAYKQAYIQGIENYQHPVPLLAEKIVLAQDGAMAFSPGFAISLFNANKDAIDQPIGRSVHDSVMNFFAELLAVNTPALPVTTLRILNEVNHGNFHWTALITDISGLNNDQYVAMNMAYQEYLHIQPLLENEVNPDIRRNNALNFIKEHKAIDFGTNSTEKRNDLLMAGVENPPVYDEAGFRLPIEFNAINMRWYDSAGGWFTGQPTEAVPNPDISRYCQRFVDAHGATIVRMPAVAQVGMTCGDHTENALITAGVVCQPLTRGSKVLRHLTNQRTVANAVRLLDANKTDEQLLIEMDVIQQPPVPVVKPVLPKVNPLPVVAIEEDDEVINALSLIAGLIAFVAVTAFFFACVPVAAGYPIIQGIASVIAGFLGFAFAVEIMENIINAESPVAIPINPPVNLPDNQAGIPKIVPTKIVPKVLPKEDAQVQAEIDLLIQQTAPVIFSQVSQPQQPPEISDINSSKLGL